jgi:predicted DNA-binding ribbon-helix-helix protein
LRRNSPSDAGPDRRGGGIRKHSVVLAGHATSLSLEAAFWDALTAIADRRGQSLNRLIEAIDRDRTTAGAAVNLSSAVRVFVLQAVQRGDP